MQFLAKNAILIAFIFAVSQVSLHAQNKILLDSNIKKLVVRNPYYILDKNCSLNFSEISSPAFSGHFSEKFNEANAPDDNSCYWLKFQIANRDAQPREWVAGFDKWQYVDFYMKLNTGALIKKSTGRFLPFLIRDFPLANRGLIKVSLKGNEEATCYVRLRSDKKDEVGAPDLSFIIYDKPVLEHDEALTLCIVYFFCGIYLIMLLYNLFIYVSIKERGYIYYLGLLIFSLIALLNNSGYTIQLFKGIPRYPFWYPAIDVISSIFFGSLILLFVKEFLKLKENSPLLNKLFNLMILCLGLLIIPVIAGNVLLANNISSLLGLITMALILTAAVQGYRRKYPSALLFLLAYGAFVVGVAIFLLKEIGILPVTTFTLFSMDIGSSIEAALFSLALANRINILKRQNELSQLKIIEQLNQYNELQVKVNRELEEKVEQRTLELRESQKQLLQKEKLAALGELTTGIAHEIQNPLNFVNNFSEVNAELLSEMEEEMDSGNYTEVKSIAGDIKNNIEKVIFHGKRADKIVKSMLLHSATSQGVKAPVNINSLADEYLKMSYHAYRAGDKTFQATIRTNYDENAGEALVNSQEFGRALLSVFNNAFYAIAEKERLNPGDYEPEISITTTKLKSEIRIIIRDNGTGIPSKVLNKIFQPFFTTKPTGIGTGLGLSLSYDTIKAHGGEIMVNTEEGQFTEFIISIPVS